MQIALPHPTATAPSRTEVLERSKKKYRDPGFALAVAQMVFIAAAEVALVVLLFVA